MSDATVTARELNLVGCHDHAYGGPQDGVISEGRQKLCDQQRRNATVHTGFSVAGASVKPVHQVFG